MRFPRANDTESLHDWLNQYLAQVSEPQAGSSESNLNLEGSPPESPRASLWWEEPVRGATTTPRTQRPVDVDQLIEQALQYSTLVAIVAAEPQIRETSIVAEQAEFDWRAYLESTYLRNNDPVGNVLTTGDNSSRFIDRQWDMEAGVRRKNQLGGQWEIAQQFGTQANNSRFLLPNPQGTSRLQLQYTQPLLNGAGQVVNGSRILLAHLDTEIAQDDALVRLQDHIVQVAEAYWELYRARAEYFQRLKLLRSAEETHRVLEGREAVDVVGRQVLRARAAVASRRTEIARARTSILNAEANLRLLVNSPELRQPGQWELTPIRGPWTEELPVSLEQSLRTALRYRADISQAIRATRTAAVTLDVADRLVLPKLDLVATTYVAGLAGQRDITSAWGDQFSEGGPGYSLGIVLEAPWGNRAAQARLRQRQLEMNRELNRFRLTVEQSLTATETAVRELATAHRELLSRHEAVRAAAEEVEFLEHRWRELPGVDDSAVLLLENLLDAQARQTDEEGALVRTQVSYALAIIRWKREMGTLLLTTDESSPRHETFQSAPEAELVEPLAPPLSAPTSASPTLVPSSPALSPAAGDQLESDQAGPRAAAEEQPPAAQVTRLPPLRFSSDHVNPRAADGADPVNPHPLRVRR